MRAIFGIFPLLAIPVIIYNLMGFTFGGGCFFGHGVYSADGKLLYMVERRDIEMRSADAIADLLTLAFDKYCAPEAAGAR